ncbi:MAG: iron chelate uptake ABC transporter family permease subunit, partial [Deltaproteobacteria bacterium]|nr:iron chelate uptake ABC transporter family permease subunit [Deltaproteobacteria bacterium]
MRRSSWYFIFLLLFTTALVIVAAAVGAAHLSLAEVWRTLLAGIPGLHSLVDGQAIPLSSRLIVWDVRLPRIIVALLVGGALGISGAVFQGLLLNPLADPFTIGVSAGAAFGATVAILLQGFLAGAAWLGGSAVIPLFAFAG